MTAERQARHEETLRLARERIAEREEIERRMAQATAARELRSE